jgi:hypothetical protein
MSDPKLNEFERRKLKAKLGLLRTRGRVAHLSGDDLLVQELRHEIDRIKQALGERGPVWWADGTPDYNGRLVTASPYASWWSQSCRP